jgi:hypothetical protein
MTQFETAVWYFLVGLDIVAITLFYGLLIKIAYQTWFEKESK